MLTSGNFRRPAIIMNDGPPVPQTSIAMATRTLLAAGFEVSGCQRQPNYAEISCERVSSLGARVQYILALRGEDDFLDHEIEDIRRNAATSGRAVILIGAFSTEDQIGWDDFLDALGGAIPSWRALDAKYGQQLTTSATNKLPPGLTGEAWLLFEDLTADGLEFIFCRHVRRLGGRKRGRTVSDMIAQLPDSHLLVIDTKATSNSFDATWPNLRPLVEYVKKQRQRQRGHNEVFGALIVSSTFSQNPETLSEISKQFFGETSVSLSFLTANDLVQIVEIIRQTIDVRNSIQWRQVFSGGPVVVQSVKEEVKKVTEERYKSGVD